MKRVLLVITLLLGVADAAAQAPRDTTPAVGRVARATPTAVAAVVPADTLPTAADSARRDSVPAAAPAPARPAGAAIVVNTGTVRFSGVVQAWYTDGTDRGQRTFRLRRTELRFAGDIAPRARWVLMVDPSKSLRINSSYDTVGDSRVVTDSRVSQASLMLQDAYVSVDFAGFTLDAGQMKLPLSYEGGVQSSPKLPMMERSMFVADGRFGLVRDMGVLLSGRVTSGVSVSLGAFNGVGENQNTTDSNPQKVVVGRVALRTFIPGLQLGTSGAWSGAETDENPRRDRLGGELVYGRGPLQVQAELMRGWDGAIRRRGYYALAAYRVGTVEVATRYDDWDRDLDRESAAANVHERDYGLGLNYYLSGTAVRLQTNLVRR
ncbi:porin, partial [Longimicrobium sp.]|uniref:porin n=1 Tax=Longimicrobium sp. TaxID=2029185 RepID=UPI002E337B6A